MQEFMIIGPAACRVKPSHALSARCFNGLNRFADAYLRCFSVTAPASGNVCSLLKQNRVSIRRQAAACRRLPLRFVVRAYFWLNSNLHLPRRNHLAMLQRSRRFVTRPYGNEPSLAVTDVPLEEVNHLNRITLRTGNLFLT